MSADAERTVLVVDDDEAVRGTLRKTLGRRFAVDTASDGQEALLKLDSGDVLPDVILLDIRMPGPDGYEVCRRIQEREAWRRTPVIFVTVLDSERDRKRALEAGGAGYLTKPFEPDEIFRCIEEQLERRDRWRELGPGDGGDPAEARRTPAEAIPGRAFDPTLFEAFKEHLAGRRELDEDERSEIRNVPLSDPYGVAGPLDMTEEQVAEELADFLEVDFTDRIEVPEQALGALPRAFCRENGVVPLEDGSVVISDPFDLRLLDALERGYWRGEGRRLVLSAPGRIEGVFSEAADAEEPPGFEERTLEFDRDLAREGEPAGAQRANEILRSAVAEGASDVHLQPQEGRTEVRFRVEGQMRTVESLSPGETAQVISRLKALAGMDLAERRRPQDGSVPAHLGERQFKLRLATSSTTHGESMVIRILEPNADPVPLEELGMTEAQAEQVRRMASRNQGSLLLVGPTGSGKSTTIYTVLSHVDTATRSVMSAEDPVEYSIEDAHQQEVNEKAGLTFEALIKSAVRQDPDVFFLGEIRDEFSARALMDFASAGHLTISSLHAANATAAIFRLGRLGVDRGTMAEALYMVISQKLVRVLCPECRDVSEPTSEEAGWLGPFTDDVPDEVARPVGCSACDNSGYRGREAVFEVLEFDREIRRRVREGVSADRLRDVFRERGTLLIEEHALAKVRSLLFSVEDVYQTVLMEEESGQPEPAEEPAEEPSAGGGPGPGRIVVLGAGPEVRRALGRPLERAGYEVVRVKDGVEALWEISKGPVGAVVCPVDMPTMDASTLLLVLERRELDVPVVFVLESADTRLEAALVGQGAADVMTLEAVPDVLPARMRQVLGPPAAAGG